MEDTRMRSVWDTEVNGLSSFVGERPESGTTTVSDFNFDLIGSVVLNRVFLYLGSV